MPKLRERLPGIQLFLGLVLAALVASGVVTRALDPAFRFSWPWCSAKTWDVGRDGALA